MCSVKSSGNPRDGSFWIQLYSWCGSEVDPAQLCGTGLCGES